MDLDKRSPIPDILTNVHSSSLMGLLLGELFDFPWAVPQLSKWHASLVNQMVSLHRQRLLWAACCGPGIPRARCAASTTAVSHPATLFCVLEETRTIFSGGIQSTSFPWEGYSEMHISAWHSAFIDEEQDSNKNVQYVKKLMGERNKQAEKHKECNKSSSILRSWRPQRVKKLQQECVQNHTASTKKLL